MNAAAWNQVKEICAQALDVPMADRAALLDRLCGTDEGLRREVESLLASDIEDDFVTPPNAGLIESAIRSSRAATRVGLRVGPFRLERVLGCGGMGDVYLASRADGEYQQSVAVKLLRTESDPALSMRRFQSERQTLARLEHPYVARLLDGGHLPDGQPYLAMEYVDGESIDRWCELRQLGVRERLAVFSRVCEAVEYAHRNLVLHCDLKPGNILVSQDGTPKLLDFGVSRLMMPADQSSSATTRGRQLMTPEYASPEQIRGEPVSTASDLYALGIVLYRLLTGQAPFSFGSRSYYEIERTLVETEPQRPSNAVLLGEGKVDDGAGREPCALSLGVPPKRLSNMLAGDLDTIIMKCLRKDPNERYKSVEQLRADIKSYLDGRPILARPPALTYVAGKFVRRHFVGVTAALIACIAVAGGASAAIWQASIARSERDNALRATQKAQTVSRKAERINQLLETLLSASDPAISRGEELTVRELLSGASQRVGEELKDEPEVEAAIRHTLGQTFIRVGQFDPAKAELRRSIELREKVLGSSHADTLDSLNSLGELHYQTHDFAAAEQVFRAVVEGDLALFGENNENTATALANLSVSLRAQNRLDEAEPPCRRALAIRERLQGRESAAYAQSLNNLSALLGIKGDNDAALAAVREVVEIRKRVLGDDHPLTVQAHANLGVRLHLGGKSMEAMPVLRNALDRQIKMLGPDHPDVGTTTSLLGKVMMAAGDAAGAEALMRESLRICRATLPEGNAGIDFARFDLGNCLRKLEKFDEAESLLLPLHKALKPSQEPGSLHARVSDALVELYQARGQPELADRVRKSP